MKKRFFLILTALVLSMSMGMNAFAADAKVLMMATTTSTDNTGLLDYLAPEFKKDTGIELKWSAMGTGKALKFGENCNADILLVHAPASEKKFVKSGFGDNRTEVMFNDFVIIGPASDPAKIKGDSIKKAFAKISKTKSPFVSRGDESGTHKKEIFLWGAANMPVPERERWYIGVGQGMLSTINIAAEKDGYTMTDRGTYIKYEANHKGNPPLKILVEGDESLFNQYSAIAVSKTNCKKTQHDTALVFIKWMSSKRGQKLIGKFTLLNKPLFTPNAK